MGSQYAEEDQYVSGILAKLGLAALDSPSRHPQQRHVDLQTEAQSWTGGRPRGSSGIGLVRRQGV